MGSPPPKSICRYPVVIKKIFPAYAKSKHASAAYDNEYANNGAQNTPNS
jgi:hypothetical protein